MTEQLLQRIEGLVLGLIETVNTHTRILSSIQEQLSSVQKNVENLERKADGIDERLETLEQAFDRDSIRIVDHERRIKRLELRPA